MGIKYFFSWLRVTYPSVVATTRRGTVDNLYIDLNGLLHPLAQKFYEYGDYRHVRLLIEKDAKIRPKTVAEFAEAVLEKILSIVHETNVTHRIMIAVDGVAPVAKQCQQRKRRYRVVDHGSVAKRRDSFPDSNSPPPFDPVCISIGTEFMTDLCFHLANLLRESPQITQEVVFSDIYVPGEGEHKIIQMIRCADPFHTQTHCIHTLDADIIMLAYLTRKNVLIYREFGTDISWINIPLLRRKIGIPPEDFILMNMILGNDFLPPIPGLDIRKEIVDIMIRGYRVMNPEARPELRSAPNIFVAKSKTEGEPVGENTSYAPATNPDKMGTIIPEKFARYLEWIAEQCQEDQEVWEELVTPSDIPTEVAQNYLDTLVWNLEYYVWGLRDWETSYAYNYTLPAKTLASLIQGMVPKKIKRTKIPDPILQLVCIVPRHHVRLVPQSVRGIFSDPEMQGYYTTDLKVVRRKAAKRDSDDSGDSRDSGGSKGSGDSPQSATPPRRTVASDDDNTIFTKYVNFSKVQTIYRRYAKNISPEDNRFNTCSHDIILRTRDA